MVRDLPVVHGQRRPGADLAIVTTDDPYREDPEQIIAQVVAGATAAGARVGRDLLVVPDRRRAIQLAIGLARPGDVVVVAGRGHERFQTVGGRRIPFDDVRVARAALARLGHGLAPAITPSPGPRRRPTSARPSSAGRGQSPLGQHGGRAELVCRQPVGN